SGPEEEAERLASWRGRRWGELLPRMRQAAWQLSNRWPRSRPSAERRVAVRREGVEQPALAAPLSFEAKRLRSPSVLDSAPNADAVLRRMARRALGYSGADIERLVREARQKARREQRALTYADLDHLLSASRPVISPEKRRRIAVHEAGHVLARILLDLGELTTVTIDTASGGFTEYSSPDDLIDTAERCELYLLATMAGRAAEQVIYGSTLSGSGGFAHSDL